MSSDATYGLAYGGLPLPSGLGSQAPEMDLQRPGAVQLTRAVVTAVYYYDDGDTDGLALYCDAIGYGSRLQQNPQELPRVLVTQSASSAHEGDIRIPRPSRGNIRSGRQGIDRSDMDPAYMDGDHILVGFLDGKKSLPVLLGYIPHPSADESKNSGNDLGDRIRPVTSDGHPRLIKHQGVYFGVDKDGGFVLNLQGAHQGAAGDGTAANGGGWSPSGVEAAATNVDSNGIAVSGNLTVKMPANAVLSFEFASGQKVELIEKDGQLNLKSSTQIHLDAPGVEIGDTPTNRAVLGDLLDTYLSSGISLNTPFGPTGPSVVPNPLDAAGVLSSDVNLK